jgi:protocatechuate 3,4-dioxygenase beta subunit
MRRRVLAGIGVVVLMGALWAALSHHEGTRPSEPSASSQRQSRATLSRRGIVLQEPTPPPSGSLRIRGVVRGEHGLASGVRVSATRPMPGETLAVLPCPERSDNDEGARGGERLLPRCMHDAHAMVRELVEARHGEVPVYAEATTAADGSFVLDGLPEGAFELWALGQQGTAMRPAVTAGTEGVELVLGEGVTLEGSTVGDDALPLSGVRVTVLHERYSRFFDVVSDEDGRFRVGPLPRGDYALVAAKEGWLSTFMPHEELDLLGWKVLLARPMQLEGRVLAQGTPAPGAEVRVKLQGRQGFEEQVTTADGAGRFSFEGLGPGTYAAVAERGDQLAVGSVELNPLEAPPEELVLNLGHAFQLQGTVSDDARRPVKGAKVLVRPEGEYVRYWHAVTDAQGHYQLGPLEAGLYTFVVAAPRYADVRDEERELTRDMGPVDFTLPRAHSIEGVVVDDEEKPVPNLVLFLTKEQKSGEEDGQEMGLAEPVRETSAWTDAEGRFLLDAVSPGDWVLEVQDERYLTMRKTVLAPSEGVRVKLSRGAMVEGTVTDALGAPMERALVSLWHPGPQEVGRAGVTVTDEQGHFSLQGLVAGRFVLEAALDRRGVESTAARPIELRDSEHLKVALRFEGGGTLKGVAVDGEGRPLSEVTIHVRVPDDAAPAWRREAGGCGLSYSSGGMITDSEGRFTLRHLQADAYHLTARLEGYTFAPARSSGGESVNDAVLRVRAEAAEVRLVLERDSRITGRLVGPDGSPVRRFFVNHDMVSDEAGAFSHAFQESGTVSLQFSAPGLAPVQRSVEVTVGKDVDLGEVRAEAGRRVEGRVLDAETGLPISGARILLSERSEGLPWLAREPLAEIETRGDGTFALPHVNARPLMLGVLRTGYIPRVMELGAGPESVTLRLDPGATLELSVRDHEGRPLDASVNFDQEDGEGWESVHVRNGMVVQRGLGPGTWLAQAQAQDGRRQRVFLPQRVKIPERGKVALSFTERREGASLVVRWEGEEAVLTWVLVPGTLSAPPTAREYFGRWAGSGMAAEEFEERALLFNSVPPGPATLMLISPGPEKVMYHQEQLDLPATGRLEKVVRPRWQPLP